MALLLKAKPCAQGCFYAGDIGCDGIDGALGVAVDTAHNAYVTGNAGAYFVTPLFVNGWTPTYNGGQVDAYVAKLSASGAAYAYCGYVGGSDDDVGYAIAVDSGGNAYVTGYTGSTQASFPVTSGPDLTYNGGSQDAFVAKIRPSRGCRLASGAHGRPETQTKACETSTRVRRGKCDWVSYTLSQVWPWLNVNSPYQRQRSAVLEHSARCPGSSQGCLICPRIRTFWRRVVQSRPGTSSQYVVSFVVSAPFPQCRKMFVELTLNDPFRADTVNNLAL